MTPRLFIASILLLAACHSDPGDCRVFARQGLRDNRPYSADWQDEVSEETWQIGADGEWEGFRRYPSARSFVEEGQLLGKSTVTARGFSDITASTDEMLSYDEEGRLVRVVAYTRDVDPITETTTWTEHDELGRPISGTRDYVMDNEPACLGMALTVTYDDDARIVTDFFGPGLEPDGAPCRGSITVERRTYDEDLIEIRTDFWFDSESVDEPADAASDLVVEERGEVCVEDEAN